MEEDGSSYCFSISSPPFPVFAPPTPLPLGDISIRRHEGVHSILGIDETTQRQKVDGLMHQYRSIAEEANRQCVPLTQPEQLKARLGEGPGLMCDTRDASQVHCAGVWDIERPEENALRLELRGKMPCR